MEVKQYEKHIQGRIKDSGNGVCMWLQVSKLSSLGLRNGKGIIFHSSGEQLVSTP